MAAVVPKSRCPVCQGRGETHGVQIEEPIRTEGGQYGSFLGWDLNRRRACLGCLGKGEIHNQQEKWPEGMS